MAVFVEGMKNGARLGSEKLGLVRVMRSAAAVSGFGENDGVAFSSDVGI